MGYQFHRRISRKHNSTSSRINPYREKDKLVLKNLQIVFRGCGMKNVIILGSGRSGTSMVAGTLAKAGYHMGEQLLPANDANPKGFFEDIEVNSINEEILSSVAPKRPKLIGNIFFKHIPLPYQRWLLALPEGKTPSSTSAIDTRIKKIVADKPFCLKDPRFSYTLPCWRPFLDNTVFIVVFREPMATAKSINKECLDDPRLHSLAMSEDQALKVWSCMYKHILNTSGNGGKEWLFVHYDQVLTKNGGHLIAEHTGAEIDLSFPEKKYKRSISDAKPPLEVEEIFLKLCEKAQL